MEEVLFRLQQTNPGSLKKCKDVISRSQSVSSCFPQLLLSRSLVYCPDFFLSKQQEVKQVLFLSASLPPAPSESHHHHQSPQGFLCSSIFFLIFFFLYLWINLKGGRQELSQFSILVGRGNKTEIQLELSPISLHATLYHHSGSVVSLK